MSGAIPQWIEISIGGRVTRAAFEEILEAVATAEKNEITYGCEGESPSDGVDAVVALVKKQFFDAHTAQATAELDLGAQHEAGDHSRDVEKVEPLLKVLMKHDLSWRLLMPTEEDRDVGEITEGVCIYYAPECGRRQQVAVDEQCFPMLPITEGEWWDIPGLEDRLKAAYTMRFIGLPPIELDPDIVGEEDGD